MLTFERLKYSELSLDQLYEIMKVRQEVFVVEQDCPYLDADDKDQESYHVLGKDENGTLQAYTRLVPPGISYPTHASIGRVITRQVIRRQRLGKQLMRYSLEQCQQLWPLHDIKISAQTYIVKFYNELGFKEVGDVYLEDDIPHIAMIRNTNPS